MSTSLTSFAQRHLAIASLSGLLAACGGGGSEDVTPTASQAAASRAQSQASTQYPEAPPPPPVNPWLNENNVVMQIQPGEDPGSVAGLVHGQVIDRLDNRPIYLISAVDSDPVTKLLQSGRVVFAELNEAIYSPEHGSDAIRNSVSAIGEPGSDPRLAPRWAETELRVPEWPQPKGAGVTVAVLDTGIDLENFGDRLATRSIDLIDRDFSPMDELPFRNRRYRWTDGLTYAYGHGTHVAGIIAKAAPGAKLMPVRVLDTKGRGTLWVVIKGIAFAVDPNDGANVLNMSFGTPKEDRALRSLIEIAGCGPQLMAAVPPYFDDVGFASDRARCMVPGKAAVSVAGAGNSPDKVLYPAVYAARSPVPVRGIVSVSATREGRRLAKFASRISSVTVAAPGDLITSTFPGGIEATMSGTSMAAPWVSATAALILSMVPPGGDASKPTVPQWNIDAVTGRISSPLLTTQLCSTSIRQIDPIAAATNIPSSSGCP